MKTRLRRLASVLAALVVVVSTQGIAQLATVDAASALPGRVRVFSETTAFDTATTKSAFAVCPSGTRVVGGGGWAFDNDAGKVHFTRLEPFHSSAIDTYAVEAASEPGFTGNWWLQAYAICVNPPAGYQVVSLTSTAGTGTFVTKFVDCPAGLKLLGTGAKITSGGREVGIQRTASDSGLTRALSTAREDATGFSGNWTLTSFGVCANPVAGASSAVTQTSGSVAIGNCPSGTAAHSVGGGGPFFDAGAVFLTVLFPMSSAGQVEVAMSGTPSHGITEADSVCAP